ncbi:MAG: TonB-dependent receptor [Proteobacteria bacterium]|nr:TonB-dependent receptor [Pseudomonadota bacterium]
MNLPCRPLAAAIALAFSSTAIGQSSPQPTTTLDNVRVSASKVKTADPESTTVSRGEIAAQRAATSDTAGLLKDVPGVSLSSAGGVSSLPSIHGMADDRNRIKVDGMDLISACANHMNSPLSYIDPSNVDSIKVYAGISPVSLGGDSIGGSIIVKSRAPRFATAGEGLLSGGELGSFYRSNGNAWGVNASATLASENLSLRYTGSTAESGNYKSAKDFKPGALATNTLPGDHWIAGNEVGSSAYKTENHALNLAYRLDNHLFDLKLAYQHIPYQGFPNQHMDMTKNESTQVNFGYTGKFAWGNLEARVYHEETRHEMNFLNDKRYWYHSSFTIPGMPMNTEGKNTGAQVKAEIQLSNRDLLRVGGEYQRYRLNDWWPASFAIVGGVPVGGMQPNTFVNINDGQRDRFDIFGEWEATWNADWQTLLGARSSTVMMDSGNVGGYNASYTAEANAFNNAERSRTDNNIDLTALARYTANERLDYEGGYARKTRSPSLYERYTWSTGGMAMAMNNWINDGNGYVGNPDLQPEVAHTLSFTADWHDATRRTWGIKVTPYYSHVDNYIDAKRCFTAAASGTCGTANQTATGKFVYLTLANNDARLYGLDLSGFATLGKIEGVGSFIARGLLGYVKGENRSTGDNLYNIMPLNAKLALEHRLGNWTNTAESVLVGGKHDTSQVRNEVPTSGYGLLHLRSSYEWKNVRLDLGLENVFDKQYALPLGGAYIGQGTTMSLGGPAYGITVPGMGRSLYAGINIKF